MQRGHRKHLRLGRSPRHPVCARRPMSSRGNPVPSPAGGYGASPARAAGERHDVATVAEFTTADLCLTSCRLTPAHAVGPVPALVLAEGDTVPQLHRVFRLPVAVQGCDVAGTAAVTPGNPCERLCRNCVTRIAVQAARSRHADTETPPR